MKPNCSKTTLTCSKGFVVSNTGKLEIAKVRVMEDQKNQLGVQDVSPGAMILSGIARLQAEGDDGRQAALRQTNVIDQLDPKIVSGLSTPKGGVSNTGTSHSARMQAAAEKLKLVEDGKEALKAQLREQRRLEQQQSDDDDWSRSF